MRNRISLCLAILLSPSLSLAQSGSTCDLSRGNVAAAVQRAAEEWVNQSLLQPAIQAIGQANGIQGISHSAQIRSTLPRHDRINLIPRFQATDGSTYQLLLNNVVEGTPNQMNLILVNKGEVFSRPDSVDPINQRRCHFQIINPNWQTTRALMLADVNRRDRFVGVAGILFHYGDFIAYVNP
jgi:hypothetical protein